MKLSERRVVRLRAELLVHRLRQECRELASALQISRLSFVIKCANEYPSVEAAGEDFDRLKAEDQHRYDVLNERIQRVYTMWLS